jgi:ATP dependent DNA ligase domain
MLLRPTFTFIPPALPSPADRHPLGGEWIHEIKHDGYRMMVRRDMSGVRVLTRNGHDWSTCFPTIAEAASGLKARSCLIDGETVATGSPCSHVRIRCEMAVIAPGPSPRRSRRRGPMSEDERRPRGPSAQPLIFSMPRPDQGLDPLPAQRMYS